MCGFLVNISPNETNQEEFKNLNNLLHSRGPDNTSYHNEKFEIGITTMFGFKRLAILDLNDTANQPMEDNLKKFLIVFNGEIYNFKELRAELEQTGSRFTTSHSDTEVILEGYKKFGKKILHKLEGQFSFVILNKENQTIFAARDRVGQKPLYYSIDKNNILFSSSIKPIERFVKTKKINFENINSYLQLGVFPSPTTLYENIFKLRNAELLELDIKDTNSLKIKTYWDLRDYIDYKEFNDEQFTDLFCQSVSKRCIADVEIAAFLSGGLDSTAIVKESSRNISNLNTYSISNSEPEYDESHWINEATKILNLNNHTFEINNDVLIDTLEKSIEAYDEPFSDSSSIPTYLVSNLMSQISKVALSGDGGDELLGGYERYTWSSYNNFIPNLINKPIDPIIKKLIFSKIFSKGTNQALSLIHSDNAFRYESFFVDRNFLKLLKIKDNNFPFIENYWVDSQENLKSMQATDLRYYLPEVMMTKVDRASMANSLEVRSPFVDHKLIEYIMSVKSSGYSTPRNKKMPLKNYLSDEFNSVFLNRKKWGLQYH